MEARWTMLEYFQPSTDDLRDALYKLNGDSFYYIFLTMKTIFKWPFSKFVCKLKNYRTMQSAPQYFRCQNFFYIAKFYNIQARCEMWWKSCLRYLPQKLKRKKKHPFAIIATRLIWLIINNAKNTPLNPNFKYPILC